MSSFFFAFRLALAWFLAFMAGMLLWKLGTGRTVGSLYGLGVAVTVTVVLFTAISHIRRVRLFAERVDGSVLANRHRRTIEVPFPPADAFAMIESAIRELPYVEAVEVARDSMQITARVSRPHPYIVGGRRKSHDEDGFGPRGNHVAATVTPRDRTSTITLICEPERGAWMDWFFVDHGANLENTESITRAITRRIDDKRKGEEASVVENATEKELAVAKLSLLHAQVEPHFLYNTLASAQLLTRSDPSRADQMLGHLIAYLRNSLPRAEESQSTLDVELDRALSYLEILRIRMGERLKMQIQVPDALKSVPMPPMMLQTLVENAIKHGLEPEPGGGTIWIIAREVDGKVSVTVADDGRGFSDTGAGTAIGLKNVRERLRLAYGDKASFAIVSNFPKGVAATITVPAAGAARVANA